MSKPVTIRPDQLVKILKQAVQNRQLEQFYPPPYQDELFERIAHQSIPLLTQLALDWNIGPRQKSLVMNLIQLALYDIVFYLDDSGSMKYGDRIEELYKVVQLSSEVCSILDQDGITIAFINNPTVYENVKGAQQIEEIIKKADYRFDTKLATNMEKKIIKPLIFDKLRLRKSKLHSLFSKQDKQQSQASNRVAKPILVITITDGKPTESREALGNLINKTKNQLIKEGYSDKSAVFQLSQVGDDKGAHEFLEYLDNHPVYGNVVDTVGTFVEESKEIRLKKGVELTYQMWVVKLLLGALDKEFDRMDEVDAS